MTTSTSEEIRLDALKEYPHTYFAAAAALFIIIGILIGNALFGKGGLLTDSDNGFLTNVFTEVGSVLVTVIVIDRLNRRRDEQRSERELKVQLVRDVRSKIHDTVVNAVHQMQERGWLEGDSGLLKGANLGGASLDGADLENANLSDAELLDANLSDALLLMANLSSANLNGANLSSANLNGANLSGADLDGANLYDANLLGANLQSANLLGVNLQGAKLWTANLQGANLLDANLQGADLDSAKLNESTRLPDGEKWTSGTDLIRFTDPQHANFWRSDYPRSPAYRREDAPPAAPSGDQP
jgi:Pentapeptide repeats (8 copies)